MQAHEPSLEARGRVSGPLPKTLKTYPIQGYSDKAIPCLRLKWLKSITIHYFCCCCCLTPMHSLVSLFWPKCPIPGSWRSRNRIFLALSHVCFRHPTLDSFNTSHLTIAWYLLTIKLGKPETGPRFGCSPPQQRKQNDRLSWNFVSGSARQCSEAWTMWYVLDFFVLLSRHLSIFLFVEIQIRCKLNQTFCIPQLKRLQQFSYIMHGAIACSKSTTQFAVCFSGRNGT